MSGCAAWWRARATFLSPGTCLPMTGARTSSADYVFDRVVPNVEDGSIVEFHLDGPSSEQATAVAIPRIVEALKERGYQFVTIPDMAQPCPAGATPVPATPLSGATVAMTPTPG